MFGSTKFMMKTGSNIKLFAGQGREKLQMIQNKILINPNSLIFYSKKPRIKGKAKEENRPPLKPIEEGPKMEKSAIRSAAEQLSQLSQLLLIKPEPEDQRINHDGEDAATAAINIVIPVQPFISLCNSLIHVLGLLFASVSVDLSLFLSVMLPFTIADKIGPTMAVLRQEIRQNIERLEMAEEWGDLVEILKKEGREGRARTESSCSRAFVWLIRSV